MKFNVSSHFHQSTLQQTQIKPANLWRVNLRETVMTHTLSKDIPGNSNRGHLFGVTLSEANRFALLEYLKTL